MPYLSSLSRPGLPEQYEWAKPSSHASIYQNSRRKKTSSRVEAIPVHIPSARISITPSIFGLYPTDTSLPSLPKQDTLNGWSRKFNKETIPSPPVSPMSIIPDRDSARLSTSTPLTSTNLDKLENTKYGDVSRQGQVKMKNRISNVSQYPVYLSRSPSTDDKIRSQRRPESMASTSSAGIYLAFGQLPGSEPFELEPPSQAVLSRHSGVPAQHFPSSDKDEKPTVYQTAQAVKVQVIGGQSNASASSVNRVSIVSTISFRRESVQRKRAASTGSIATTSPTRGVSIRPSMRASRTWPDNLESNRRGFNSGEVTSVYSTDLPPPPPPKDQKYINHKVQPKASNKRLQHSRSSPHLSSYGNRQPAEERTDIVKEAESQEKTRQRNWFGELLLNHNLPRSPRRFFTSSSPSKEKFDQREDNDILVDAQRKSSLRRGSQALVACARFVGRAVSIRALSRSSVLKGSQS